MLCINLHQCGSIPKFEGVFSFLLVPGIVFIIELWYSLGHPDNFSPCLSKTMPSHSQLLECFLAKFRDKIMKKVSQMATIAHLRAESKVIQLCCQWSNLVRIKLIQNIMHVLVTYLFEKDLIDTCSHRERVET